MPTPKAHDEIEHQAEAAQMESVWEVIRHHLENERHRIHEEIKNYPTPITACDAQFNFLLEERTQIPEEVQRLEALAREGLASRDQINRLGEFIASSNYIKGEVEQTIRSFLRDLANDVD